MTTAINDQFKMVDLRLKMWGSWYLAWIRNEVGYSKQSAFLNIPTGNVGCKIVYPKQDEQAQEIHKIIVEINHECPQYADLLRTEYTEPGSQVQKITKSGLSLMTYRRLLELAKMWVKVRLA
jgi:hypothetical protein